MNTITFLGTFGEPKGLKEVAETTVFEVPVVHDIGYGENKKSMWYQARIWGKLGVTLSEYIQKGRQAHVEGELSVSEWEDKEGKNRYSLDLKLTKVTLARGVKEEDAAAPAAEGKPADMPF